MRIRTEGKGPVPTDDVVGTDRRDRNGAELELGDFTMPWRTLRLVPLAVGIGAVGAVVALVLLDLIGLITNLAYYQRWSVELDSPAENHLGPLAILVPVVGA